MIKMMLVGDTLGRQSRAEQKDEGDLKHIFSA
jgi:hypothetical protein